MTGPRSDGGAAFPLMPPVNREGVSAPGYPYPEEGISARDYFAAKAMQGFCADPTNHELFKDQGEVAQFSYRMADAMLAERAK